MFILYFISFIESIIFPIPTDPFLIPFIITEKKFFRLAIFTTLFSVLGGIVAYFLGSFLWESLEPFLKIYFYGIFSSVNEFEKNFLNLGILLIIFGGIVFLSVGIIILRYASHNYPSSTIKI